MPNYTIENSISANSFHILVWKMYKIFYILHFQKRIIVANIKCKNIVYNTLHPIGCWAQPRIENKSPHSTTIEFPEHKKIVAKRTCIWFINQDAFLVAHIKFHKCNNSISQSALKDDHLMTSWALCQGYRNTWLFFKASFCSVHE
jgi:hypothetical protein